MVASTRVRGLVANFRLEPEDADDIAAGHAWTNGRRDATAATFDRIRGAGLMPSVIMGQECSTTLRSDLWDILGRDRWLLVRNGNVIVLWDGAQHESLDAGTARLPTPVQPDGSPGDPRRLVWVELRVKGTGDRFWAASSHFTVGDAVWQRQQMAAVVDLLPNPRNTIFGADINNDVMEGDCPRSIARAGGLFDLRSKLALPRITNVSFNSFNGWATTRRDGLWIDDLFTGNNLQPYYGNMIRTEIEGASDHNWLLVSSIQIVDET
jgi:hypothetical protein